MAALQVEQLEQAGQAKLIGAALDTANKHGASQSSTQGMSYKESPACLYLQI